MMRPAAIVLAAGRSSRYRAAGGLAPTKLVAPFEGTPLVRRPSEAALAAGLQPVIVVTGHAADEVALALAGLPLRLVHNPDYGTGLASSLRVGLASLPADAEAVLILLGDMPLVGPAILRALVAAAEVAPQAQAVVPVTGGRRGNPVLLRRALFAAASALPGDEGARRLLRDPALTVVEVAIDGDGAARDIDGPEGFAF